MSLDCYSITYMQPLRWLFGSAGKSFSILIIVTDCGIPTHPGANGDVVYTETTFRATASYSCMPECYMLRPDVETRMCLANGSWSGETPSCHCESNLNFSTEL